MIDSESSLRAAVNQFRSLGKTESDPVTESETALKKEQEYEVKTGEQDQNSHTSESEADAERKHLIVSKGVIDLKKIDENNDGKVFQDMMDWNVISDEPGRCPICDMILQEVSIEEARNNLIQNGYQAK
jgi:Cu(I)/Ag(I) efflux system membrane fusion protein/cobalt-zinc-cadmium efflux system membrane fusion protein